MRFEKIKSHAKVNLSLNVLGKQKSKLHNLETHFCELLRPHAPPFQKIKRNPLNQVTFMQKSCFLGPTIFEIPQPN